MARGGELRGWVVGTIASGTLAEEVAGISQNRFNRPDRVLLVDDALRVLAGGAAGELGPEHSLAGRGIFRGVDVPPGAFRVQFGLTTEFQSESGEAMVGTVQSVRQQGWAVVVQRPEQEAFGALAASRRASLIAAGVVALIAIALGALLAARTTRPVRALVELTRAYGRRDFSGRSLVRTGDELELLGASMSEMAEKLEEGEAEIARRAAVEASLSRYVPAEVARSIAEGRQILRHGGERRVISVVFADVVGFTAMSEHLPPEKVVALLNELFTVMTEVVFRHGGTVDKFMGDSVMALFGALNSQPDHEVRALSAAEDMHRFVEASAPAWKTSYGMDVRLGIGVNSGEALVGNLGSDLRMEYTAIGDVINVASRLEALARPGQTLVTADVAEAVKGVFSLADLGEHPIRGKRQTVRIYELR
jgi:class 3 adenylate cyclase